MGKGREIRGSKTLKDPSPEVPYFPFREFGPMTAQGVRTELMHRSKRRAQMDDLFDHLVSNGEHPWRECDTERCGGLEVDDELELG